MSLGLIALLLYKIGLERLFLDISSARLDYVLIAILIFVLSMLLGAAQWYLLLVAQGIQISFGKAALFYFIGMFFNNVLPGNIAGDAVRVYDVRRLSGEGSRAFAATFMDRFVGFFFLISLSIAAFAFSDELWDYRLLLFSIGLLCLVSAGALCVGLSRRLGTLAERAALAVAPTWIAERLKKVKEALFLYRSRLRLLCCVALISLCVQVLRIAVHYVAGLSLDLDVGFKYFLVFVPLVAIFGSVPISFGGLGVMETIEVLFFSLLDVESSTAFSIGLLARFAGIVSSVIGGVLFVMGRGEREPQGLQVQRLRD